MTTAPDLPFGCPSVVDAAPAARPPLALVPAQPTGEEIAFDEALRRATPRLTRYATRRLHDQHEAEEVVQEAMLRAFQHRAQLATEDDLMAWLTVVTGRLAIDRLRVRGRSTPVAEMPPSARASRDTADVVVARDEARLALDALEAMPARQASVLWAREVEGLSYDEIGDRFGMSEPSVRSLLHRARRTLRREYSARGGSFPAVGLVALAPWVHGLRAAGRLRSVVRRTAGAAVVTAGGLAAVTVIPFASPTTPAHTAAPVSRPAVVEKAAVTPHRRPAVHHHRVVAPVSGATDATSRTASGTPARPVAHATFSQAPHLCGSHGYSVNCVAHHAHTLYVGPSLPVPVAGARRIGVSNTAVDCVQLPATPVTQCDTQGDTQ